MKHWSYKNRKRPKGNRIDTNRRQPIGLKSFVVPFGNKKKADGDERRDKVRRDES